AAPCASANWVTRQYDVFEYDAKHRPFSTDHPDGTRVLRVYDSRGNLTSLQDERHTSPNLTYSYTPFNRVKTTTQQEVLTPGNTITTQFSYDVHEHVTSTIDPKNNSTSTPYDDWGRLQYQDSPVSHTTTYTYDDAGNVATITDANNAVTTNSYDLINR